MRKIQRLLAAALAVLMAGSNVNVPVLADEAEEVLMQIQEAEVPEEAEPVQTEEDLMQIPQEESAAETDSAAAFSEPESETEEILIQTPDTEVQEEEVQEEMETAQIEEAPVQILPDEVAAETENAAEFSVPAAEPEEAVLSAEEMQGQGTEEVILILPETAAEESPAEIETEAQILADVPETAAESAAEESPAEPAEEFLAEPSEETAEIMDAAEEEESDYPEEVPEPEEENFYFEEQIEIDPSSLPDNEELHEEYISRLFDLSGIQTLAEHGRRYLNGKNLTLYNRLRELAENIAAGKETSTDVTYSDINFRYTYEEMGLDSAATATEAQTAFKDAFDREVSFSLIIDYLISDCPYELYWYDKTSKITMGWNLEVKKGSYAQIKELYIRIPVSADYQDGSEYKVSTKKTAAANKAADNAQAIVAKHANETELERLYSYKQEICDLVSYDTEASSDAEYGDPWQLVYVFDGDSSTNVVCEGYAKAFQYLCDLDGGDKVCYLVTGDIIRSSSSGRHMWNIVKLDGVKYFVDVTNSDSGAVGQNGGLFLLTDSDATAIEKDDSGYPIYTFTVNKTAIRYVYDAYTTASFPVSVLTLGKADAIDLSGCTITLSESSFVYDGKQKKPEISVTYGNENLFEMQDYYNVVYKNNTDAGTASVTISGMGDYTGEASAQFKIEKASQSVSLNIEDGKTLKVGKSLAMKADGIGDITYKSSDTSIATVDKEGTILALSPGSVTITATAAGDGNHKSASASAEIKVTYDLSSSDCTVSLSKENYTYTGREKEPTAVVKAGNKTLTEGKDYSVSYKNNVNAGTASATVTGMGYYTGSQTAEFTISKASQTVTAEADASSIKVGKTTAIAASGKGTITYSSSDPAVASVSSSGVVTGKAAGTAVITVNAAGNSNYKSGSTTVKIKVKADSASMTALTDISGCKLSLSETTYYYDGTKKKPTVTVKNGSAKLKKGTDYTVSYSNNKKIGTATVTVTGQGSYTGSAEAAFQITVKKGAEYAAGDFTVSITKAAADGSGTVKITGPADKNLTKAEIPASVKIGGVKFQVTAIAAEAFKSCTNLKSASIGSNVETIGNKAFQGCKNMTKVTIKKSVKKIGKKAFYNCGKLSGITIKSKVLASVGEDAFKGIPSTAVITVPASELSAYKKLLKGKGQSSKVTITA